MLDAARVQRPRDVPGAEERRRPPLLGLPPRCVRPALDRRLHEGRAALVRRVRFEPPARARNQLLVPRVGLVEDLERHRDGGRLAARRPPVRLERVAEPAVGVAEGGDRVADRPGVAAGEEPLEAAAVEDAGVTGDELGRRVEVGHSGSIGSPRRTRPGSATSP